jgi:EmrB/QacA subfamily drug resistance transporter
MRRYFTFFGVSLALFLGSVNVTAITVAFPFVIEELKISVVLGGWILNAFQLTQIALIPVAGRLSETMGRRSSFLLFTGVFTIGSALCAVAPDAYSLIFFRVVQAAGGAGFLPSAAGIVSDEFPQSRQKAIGLFSSVFPIGSIIGPNLGAVLIDAFGWRATFSATAAIGVIVIIMARFLLRRDSEANVNVSPWRSLDFVGAGWLAGFLFLFMLGLTQLSKAGNWQAWAVALPCFLAGGGFLYGLVRRERSSPNPILDLNVLRGRPFVAANIFNTVYGLCAFGIFTLIPLYTITTYNLTVIEAGLVLTPRFFGMMAASTVTSLLINRWGYRGPMLFGSIIIVLCLGALAMPLSGTEVFNPATILVIIMLFTGVGAGMSAPAANNACIELLPEHIPTITALRSMFRQLGGAVGIAISTVIIQGMGGSALSFTVVFALWGTVMLATIPTIFAMPASSDNSSGATRPHETDI